MLISKIQDSIDEFARREKFQYSEIEVDMLLIGINQNLKSIDVNMELSGLTRDGKIEFSRTESVEFELSLGSPDIFFEVVKDIVILEKGSAYKGINIVTSVHIPTKGDVIILGDGAKDGTVPSFEELFVKRSKAYMSGKIIIDFELNVDSKKYIDKDAVRKMFKDGKIEPLVIDVEWIHTIRN